MAGMILAVLAAGCGDDATTSSDDGGASSQPSDDSGSTQDDSSADDSSDDSAEPEPAEDSAEPEPVDDGTGGGGGGTGGTLVLDGETIAFDSARCFLEEQDAAAGGGKILFVAQAFGTNADGDEVAIDVSRYDEDSQFTGDDIIVDIGDPFSDDAVSLSSILDLGTVNVDGSTLSVDALTFSNFDDGTEVSASFEINC